MAEHIVSINSSACIGCALCTKDCPTGNIALRESKALVTGERCIACGHCVAICPKAAVSMSGFPEPPIPYAQQPRVNPEQLLQALRARRSIRQFTKEPVSQELAARIIEAGRWSPTAKNAKSVSYLILRKEKAQAEALAVRFFRKMLALVRLGYAPARSATVDNDFLFKGAPLAIVIQSKDKVSASLAASNMALMAESCGLGVLYSGFFTMAANHYAPLRTLLGTKGDKKAVTTLVLGYSAVHYPRSTQKEAAEVSSR